MRFTNVRGGVFVIMALIARLPTAFTLRLHSLVGGAGWGMGIVDVFYCRYRRATVNANYALGKMYNGASRITGLRSLLLFMVHKVTICGRRLHGRKRSSRRTSGFVCSSLFVAVAGTGFSGTTVVKGVGRKLHLGGRLNNGISVGGTPSRYL